MRVWNEKQKPVNFNEDEGPSYLNLIDGEIELEGLNCWRKYAPQFQFRWIFALIA